MDRFAPLRCGLPLLAAAAALLLSAAPLAAQPAGDEMLLLLPDHSLLRSPLPAGPPVPLFDSVVFGHLVVMPNGQILATGDSPPPPPYSIRGASLNELMSDGSLRWLRTIVARGFVRDMGLDHRGRLFILATYLISPFSQPFEAFLEVHPVTGEIISSRELPGVHGITTAPDGLWALKDGKLHKLDPDTLALGLNIPEFGGGSSFDASSDGKLYFRPLCSTPPCVQMATFDPATRVTSLAPESLYGAQEVQTFAIDRRCRETATARCLQGGRYRAEIEYVAYDGAAGFAQASPARSADTAVFSFFDPDNWELMVKVLDGCAINGHVWVYAAASTDVGYEMKITDTLTGAQKTYSNALGHVAETVTDGSAFSCLE